MSAVVVVRRPTTTPTVMAAATAAAPARRAMQSGEKRERAGACVPEAYIDGTRLATAAAATSAHGAAGPHSLLRHHQPGRA